MGKILSQSGKSLADVYDIKGSIAGVDELRSEEVSLVHGMGETIFSERLVGEIRRMTTGDIAASATWDLTAVGGVGVYRVVGVYVQADVGARTSLAQVSLRSARQGRELPIFVWDTANDVSSSIRILDNGAAISTDAALIQANPMPMLPMLGIADGQRLQVGDEIVFRGVASAFGAGTVEVIALIYLAEASVGAARLPSVGLPIPGW